MNKIRITSLILTITFISLISPAYNAFSQEEIQRPTKPEKECDEIKPKFLERAINGMDFTSILKLESDIDKGEVILDYKKFQEIIDGNKDGYHKYVECIFNYGEKTILGNVGLSKGTIQAGTPNIDWMDPKAACLTPDKLKEVMDNTSPNQLLAPLLEIQSTYSDYLDALVTTYKFEGREGVTGDEDATLSGIDTFINTAQMYTNINLQADLEKEASMVAMNITFGELKELRLSFIMHVQFQCMLNNLEKYRKWLGDIRTMIEGLPTKLEDASMTK